ncbi:leucine-rich repeat receptor-like serine/threonine/tyrosine-protein kinase SOBIR1 [Macadamia integrifolia]|uniref:leucine-rich repeat receptor-like serine/threonine/tyrosine-protein kinase SOBIR1 n=1 Tax=Macadamia integrifolia TaxID=60698 RepID=UPI001C4F0F0A|nr:leucine-rich repeat receptor-like serine/threonine/tyrosine-protein kinase SOBIR1 [Macadamia integrifolia]
MASSVIEVQLYLLLLALVCPLYVVKANLILHPSDLDAISTLWTGFGFPTHQLHISPSRNGNPCHETEGIHCEKRISAESPPVLRVTRIVLDSRGLNGSLSPSIGRLSELKELSLSNNLLVDQIPTHIVDCQKLEILNLRNNLFSGEIPSEVSSSLIRLRSLDLSSNRFSGDLSFLRYFPNLENLSLADNLFYGRIPNSLRSFPNLQYLNLSGNNYLQGPIPAMNQVGYSASPRLKTKTRTTSLPKRYILTENSSKSNHPIRGVAIAPSPSNAEAPSPSASLLKHHTSKRKLKSSVIGLFCGVTTGIISWFILSILFKLLLICIIRKGRDSGTVIFSSLIKDAKAIAFLEKEDGLTSLELIGRGGCGEVYKTELPGSNGKIIAIKKILQPQPQPQPHPQQLTGATELAKEDSKFLTKKLRQIRSEIKTVGQIRHRNLLPLLAHVPRPDCHLLVYEYMKNGSLQELLHQVSQGTRELEWKVRHRIATGIAAGLEYLHMHHSQRIIHRDLKPANILLDDETEARIADFGLAKAVPDANTHVTTSNVAGTVGYIAPEYHQTLKFTEKCDIYSFGVMLAVLVMRKLPSDDFFQQTAEMSLVKWLRNILTSEDPRRAIDEKLMGNGYEEQMLLVLKIACFCTVDNPKERPNSTDVRCMLSQIKP